MSPNIKKSILTDELIHSLSNSKNIDNFLGEYEEEINDISIHIYLNELIQDKGFTISQIIEKSNISKSLAYQIFNGKRSPNRNIVLQIALIIKLNLEETQRLLKLSKKGELYPRIQRDAAIIFCIQHKYSLMDTNEMLEELGEAMLFKEE